MSSVLSVVLGPVLTEKALILQKKGVWSFWVDPKANKYQISQAVEKLFGVIPVKVRVIKVKPKAKNIWRHRKVVTLKVRKKAYVELKSGDKIKSLIVKESK